MKKLLKTLRDRTTSPCLGIRRSISEDKILELRLEERL